ncbi:response regulator [Chitinophaga rhizophila]|uniref:Response regulator n=1 Tax=Chitinophaga rhizophila TaxID=2866212 RepID=A0ABS7G9Q1_9BACT|nr:response regulator [Chitinophaga rhizophila]MBW8684171.1 response regulator [Chitinophaga rhizophila]
MNTEKSPVTCFVVDDDIDDQELFSAAMENSILKQYSCVFASDGVEAMERLNEGLLPDYIFLDLNMPRLDGLECLSEIRNQEKLKQIPIAIYSTSSDEHNKAQALSLGATAFISKPTKFNELVNRLSDFFTTYKPTQQGL